jgi:hypothetical protein
MLALTSMKSFDQRIKSYQFGFGGTSSVNFLFHRDGADGTRAKSHSGPSVTFHFLVGGKGGINMPLDHTSIIGTPSLGSVTLVTINVMAGCIS